MLSLDSPRWQSLEHAYGTASDTPVLLAQLETLPRSQADSELWHSLWSSLAHQGDVYSASFAAVPHIVARIESAPTQVDSAYFQFPAWVEICRSKSNLVVPEDLAESYWAAIEALPRLAARASDAAWDEDVLLCVLAAIATAKGSPNIAEAILELDSDVARDFLEWHLDR